MSLFSGRKWKTFGNGRFRFGRDKREKKVRNWVPGPGAHHVDKVPSSVSQWTLLTLSAVPYREREAQKLI